MKNAIRIFLLSIVICSLFTIVTCSSGDETATISISLSSLPGGPAKAVSMDKLQHVIVLSGPADTQTLTITGSGNARATVAVGLWSIRVTAYYEGKIYAVGNATAEVRAGRNTDVSVQMTVVYDETGGAATGNNSGNQVTPGPTPVVSVTATAATFSPGDLGITFTAVVTGGATATENVIWSVAPSGGSTSLDTNTRFNPAVAAAGQPSGAANPVKLDIGSSEISTSITVTAALASDPTVKDTATITRVSSTSVTVIITNPPVSTVDLEARARLSFDATVSSGNITWTATHSDGTTETVLTTSTTVATFTSGAAPSETGNALYLLAAAVGDIITVVASADDDPTGASTATVVVTVVPAKVGTGSFAVDAATGAITVSIVPDAGITAATTFDFVYSGTGVTASPQMTVPYASTVSATAVPISAVNGYTLGEEVTCTISCSDTSYDPVEVKITVYKVVIEQDVISTWNDELLDVNGTTYPTGAAWADITVYGEEGYTVVITLDTAGIAAAVNLIPGTLFGGTAPSLVAPGDDATYTIDDADATLGVITITAAFVP